MSKTAAEHDPVARLLPAGHPLANGRAARWLRWLLAGDDAEHAADRAAVPAGPAAAPRRRSGRRRLADRGRAPQAEAAKRVVHEGEPELAELMDAGQAEAVRSTAPVEGK